MGTGNIRKFEIRLGQTGLTVLIVGMVVLLCVSFLFGVGVGKNIDTYPEKISSLPQRFLALFWRPAKIASGQKTAPSTQAQPEQSNVDLAFHQALTSSKPCRFNLSRMPKRRWRLKLSRTAKPLCRRSLRLCANRKKPRW